MTILMARAPRKSNFVVRGGTLWWVDWASGEMRVWSGKEAEESNGAEKELPELPLPPLPLEDPPEYSRSTETSSNPSAAGSIHDEMEIEEIRQVETLTDIDTSGKVVERIEVNRVDSVHI